MTPHPQGNALRQAAAAILPRLWATAHPTPALVPKPNPNPNPAPKPNPHPKASSNSNPHGLFLVAAADPLPQSAPTATPRRVRTHAPAAMAFYRKYTEAVLARYSSMSFEAARVPSLIGRELFPGSVSHTRVTGFDDVVHFVHDVGNCLKELSPGQQAILRKVAVQGYDQAEAAAQLGFSLRSFRRRYQEALDLLTSILLYRHLLEPLLVADQAP